MPRIRNVKPEFFRHEDLQILESKHPRNRVMLTFSGLWTQCDRQGVFQYKPNQLHLDILPFVKFDIEGTLNILVAAGYIQRFTVDGSDYGFIPTFRKHQAISGKEMECKFHYPEPPKDTPKPSKEPPNDDPEPTNNTPEQAENILEQEELVPDEFQSSSTPVPDRPDFMTSLHRDIRTSEYTQERALGETSVAVFKPRVETELFTAIEQTFLSVSGKFTDPPAEINAIRTIMRYVDNNPGDAEAMLATFLNLTRGDDGFWKRQPFTPSRLARPKIWDSVKAEAKKQIESPRESWEDMERRLLAKKAAKVAGI